jgi:hypothetical protein
MTRCSRACVSSTRVSTVARRFSIFVHTGPPTPAHQIAVNDADAAFLKTGSSPDDFDCDYFDCHSGAAEYSAIDPTMRVEAGARLGGFALALLEDP